MRKAKFQKERKEEETNGKRKRPRGDEEKRP